MHKLPTSLAISDSEKVISDFSEGVDDLSIVKDWSNISFSGIATAVQASITWGKRSQSKVLFLPKTQRNLDDTIEGLINKPHQFVAAMFAKSIVTQDNNESLNVRSQVNLAAKSNIEKQQSNNYGQQRGGLCWFAFVDHSRMGFDKNFYLESTLKKPTPRDQSQLQSVIFSMISKSTSISGGSKEPNEKTKKLVGRLFYELFINTHQHGSRGVNRDEWLKPAVRLIYTQGINLTIDGVNGTLKDDPALQGYIGCDFDKARYIEISIVDSGLGYYKRWISDRPSEYIQSPSVDDEYKIFKRCFSFRQGSTGRDEKGNGLPVVMQRLTELGGFMRIRSGRLSLFRDFVKSPYNNDESCGFYDWTSLEEAENKLTAMAPVEGVSITLLIPLEGKR